MLSETEKAYLAGLIDGEGCITILKSRQSGPRRSHLIHHRLALVISQANLAYLEHWREKTGLGRVYNHRKDNRGGKWAQVYQWHLASREAATLLKAVQPYLSLKQDQAKIALNFASTMGEEGTNLRSSASLFRRREEAYGALKALHGRHGNKALDIEAKEYEPARSSPDLQMTLGIG